MAGGATLISHLHKRRFDCWQDFTKKITEPMCMRLGGRGVEDSPRKNPVNLGWDQNHRADRGVVLPLW